MANSLTAFPTERAELYPNGLTTVIPIFGSGERLGTIILARTEGAFNDDDLVLAEYGATVIGMEILYQQFLNVEEKFVAKQLYKWQSVHFLTVN